ncbi:MAG: PRD domain-containing protein, partial [Lachnospiraceae bacterium]
MKVGKIINNNVISATDLDGTEVVIMGKGIGFQTKHDEEVKENLIEKVFKMDNKNSTNRFTELLKEMPSEHFEVSNEVIEYAKSILGKKLNQNIYITLTDHINFAIERYKQGLLFENPLLWEVKKFYPTEYLIGEYAIALIERKLQVKLQTDEAASVALHIVNAEYNTAMNETMNLTLLIKDVIGIVRDFMNQELDEESLYYMRFMTHLKFLSQRMFAGETHECNKEDQLTQMVINLYEAEYHCSQKIGSYIKEKYGYAI